MAQLPIEIVRVGGAPVDNLEAIIVLLNQLQDAFKFNILIDDTALEFQGASNYRFTTAEIYELFDSLKQRIKGYHPHLIGVVERQLDGARLGNLFGSMKQEGAHLQGMAIASLYQIPALLDPVPIDVYVVFELLSFAVRFLHGEGLIHRERRGCVFDQKIDKREIVNAIKVGRFCPHCENIVNNLLDSDQEIAVERIFRVIHDIANADDPVGSWKAQVEKTANPIPKVFLCHSSHDKDFVRRIATNLVDEGCRVWFDAWEIRVGDNIVYKINDGLQDSGFLAVVLSRAAMESEWVKKEWTSKFMMAAEERNATVLPILLEDCEIPPLLRPLKFADFRNPENYDLALADVVQAIESNGRNAA